MSSLLSWWWWWWLEILLRLIFGKYFQDFVAKNNINNDDDDDWEKFADNLSPNNYKKLTDDNFGCVTKIKAKLPKKKNSEPNQSSSI